MVAFRIIGVALLLSFASIGATGGQQKAARGLLPLHKMQSEQWIENVSGDPDKSGAPFVIRIHNDAGFVCLPHTHPTDENIVVVKGTWSLGMGKRFNPSALQPLELGAFGLMPKGMAHFCRSTTEMIIQVHGTGPFDIDMVDPLYQLTDKGVTVMSRGTIVAPRDEHLVQNWPQKCFALKLGDHARGPLGEGTVVGAQCSPANDLTQYWIRKANGERFWATQEEVKKL